MEDLPDGSYLFVAYFLQSDTVTGPIGVQKHIFGVSCEASLQCLETFTGVLLSRELYFNTVNGPKTCVGDHVKILCVWKLYRMSLCCGLLFPN